MRLLFGTVLALAIAAVVGLGVTWIALTRGSAYGGVTIGAWTGWPKNGTAGIDPYREALVEPRDVVPGFAVNGGQASAAQIVRAGAGRIVGGLFWALRAPYRWTRDYVFGLMARPDVLNLSEQTVLHDTRLYRKRFHFHALDGNTWRVRFEIENE